MTDAFKKLEQSYEAKFKLDQENQFKAEAKRNKLLGLWVAEKFNLTGDAAQAYAKEVIDADFEEPGIEDVVRKVMKDFADRDISLDKDELLKVMDGFFVVALEELGHEFPEPLSNDHSPVGG
ncbi:MAG: DUF1476 domain-containing protein [Rhodospirillales bacterium]|nr:DUF1476 domain-containing protein [Rhodospirillales bacterium]